MQGKGIYTGMYSTVQGCLKGGQLGMGGEGGFGRMGWGGVHQDRGGGEKYSKQQRSQDSSTRIEYGTHAHMHTSGWSHARKQPQALTGSRQPSSPVRQ